METLIYSASPLKAFSGIIITITGLFLIGVFGAYAAISPTKRKSQNFTRVLSGCASIVLFLACIGVSLSSYNSYKNGQKTVVVRLSEKNQVTRKCGERSYCTDNVLETTDGTKYFVFGVDEDTWKVMEVNSCYQFTYYQSKPLLADMLNQDRNSYNEYYEPTGQVTRVERAGCP